MCGLDEVCKIVKYSCVFILLFRLQTGYFLADCLGRRVKLHEPWSGYLSYLPILPQQKSLKGTVHPKNVTDFSVLTSLFLIY